MARIWLTYTSMKSTDPARPVPKHAQQKPKARPDAPDDKPDEHNVRVAEEAEQHVAEKAAERKDGGEADEDLEHGYTQDSGYAQSGGAKKGT